MDLLAFVFQHVISNQIWKPNEHVENKPGPVCNRPQPSATVRNRPQQFSTALSRSQPFATIPNRSREGRIAVPMASFERVVTWSLLEVSNMLHSVSKVDLMWLAQYFCIARRFQKMSSSFRGRRSTLETSIVMSCRVAGVAF